MGFSGNSVVAMSDFSYKPIDTIKIGEYVLGFSLELDTTHRRPINMSPVIYTATRKEALIQWDLSNGQKVQVTGSQQVLGRLKIYACTRWATAAAYAVGDTLSCFCGYDTPRRGDYFRKVTITHKCTLPEQVVYTLEPITNLYIVNSIAVKTTY